MACMFLVLERECLSDILVKKKTGDTGQRQGSHELGRAKCTTSWQRRWYAFQESHKLCHTGRVRTQSDLIIPMIFV